MDAIEKQYYSKPKNHLSIRHYVTSLLDADRIIEASFFCEKMLQEAPKNRYANKLAFLLAIRRIDHSVSKYDEALANSNMEFKERLILHCKYYFTYNQPELLKLSLSAAMDEGLSDNESLSIVLEFLLWTKDIRLTRKFVALYMRNAKITQQAEFEIRKILHTNLVDIISSMRDRAHD